ncbi:MAG: PfkB family carbohydrate kinase [Rectinemataceae bacterium]
MTTIAGAGCSLIDYIHTGVDFSSPEFAALRSRNPGDGGLEPGALVFAEDFERFAGRDLDDALMPLLRGRAPDACNIGGPGVVSLIHAAQILYDAGTSSGQRFSVSFRGVVGDDPDADHLRAMLGSNRIEISGCLSKPGKTPFTLVLSDSGYDRGRGERSFINEIGAAASFQASDLPEAFFDSTIVTFGGTALTPALHDSLDGLLARAKSRGALTIVNTVYDYRNQRRDPVGRWPLGSRDEAWPSIDLLITDLEEARRLSGRPDATGALAFFRDRGVGAAVVTAGTSEIFAASWTGERFAPAPERTFPVSGAIVRELADHPERRGDTTGCGDNFAGGLIASAAMQLDSGAPKIDLKETLAWGAASGGFACFHVGGVWLEPCPGDKRRLLEPYVEAWRRQVEAAR